jgi:hypothetical protein
MALAVRRLTDGPRRVHVVRRDADDIDAPVAEAVARAATILADAGYGLDESGPPIAATAELWAPLMTTDVRRVWPDLEPLASSDGVHFMRSIFDRTPPLDVEAFGELFVTRQQLARQWSEHQAVRPLVLAPISTRTPFRPAVTSTGHRQRSASSTACRQRWPSTSSASRPSQCPLASSTACHRPCRSSVEGLCLAAAALVQRTATPIAPRDTAAVTALT